MTTLKLSTQDALSIMQQLITNCQELSLLLNQDKTSLSQPSFDKLHKSNQQKAIVLTNILNLLKPYEQIMGTNGKTLFACIDELEKQIPLFSNTIKKQKNELKRIIQSCYESLNINQVVVNENISSLNHFFNEILNKGNNMDVTYENLGK